MAQKLRFIDVAKSNFFATVKQRVDAYFNENELSKNANTLMYIKSIFFIGGTALFYGLILSNAFPLWVMLLFALFLGMFAGFTAINVGHDAIHGAYSANARTNKWLSHTFNFLGANAYMWSIQHNIVHHTYTNIPGHDEDIEVAPGLIRLSPEDKIYKIQKFQHIYGFLLYSLASMVWVFKKDYMKFFQKKIGHVDTSNHPKSELFNLFFYKAIYYALFIVIPLMVLNITWWQFVIGFVVMHMAEGLVLGLIFQLAHIVEGTEFPLANEEGNIEEAWAIHQMRTTADFSRKSWLAAWLCGGLNMQIEHHLFPKMCHIHYPAVSRIVKKTALEHGLPYIESITFFGALKSHYRMLKKFGWDAQTKSTQKNDVGVSSRFQPETV